jgi:putative flippase GtrA
MRNVFNIIKIWNSYLPIRFIFVGVWNFLFGYILFMLLYYTCSEKISERLIVLISSFLGITNSFISHRLLTYHSKGIWWKEYLRFFVVYGGQIILNLFLITFFVTYCRFNAYIVQFVILIGLTFLSYWGHKIYSFKDREN